MPLTRSWRNKPAADTRRRSFAQTLNQLNGWITVRVALLWIAASIQFASIAAAAESAGKSTEAGGAGSTAAGTPFAYQLPVNPQAGGAGFWQVMGNLILVLLLLGGGLYVLKRFLPGRLGDLRRSRHMRVLDTMNLTMGRSLMLLHIGNEVHLIANTEKGIESLGKVNDLGAIQQEVAEEFAETLNQELGMDQTLGRLKNRLRRLGEESR